MEPGFLVDPLAWLEGVGPLCSLGVRVELRRAGEAARYPRLDGSSRVARTFAFLRRLDREVFLAAFLDTKHRMTGVSLVSVGTLDASLVHPREVFKAALVANAAAVLCVHNHPSGDPAPSREDLEITRRLAAAGELLGVAVLDHVIVAAEGWVSLRERGVL